MNLPQIVAAGDRKSSLEALRQVLAEAIANDCPPRDLAPLVTRLTSVMNELEELAGPSRSTNLDDIAARRSERLRQATG